jgi:hypothetical protein
MDESKTKAIREDFETWSGGFPPESDEQITVYIDYASSKDWDDDEVRELLRAWMDEPDDSCT